MSGWRLLSAEGGMLTHMVKQDGKLIIRNSYDVEADLEANAAERQHAESGWKGEMHKVASIPPIVVEQWWKELGDNPLKPRNRKWLIAKLNSSDWLKLRTKEGNL